MGIVNTVGDADMSIMEILAADNGNRQKETVKETFSQLVQDKKAEYLRRIQNGSSEQSYQIGAGSYTETEWKKLIRNFDVADMKEMDEDCRRQEISGKVF